MSTLYTICCRVVDAPRFLTKRDFVVESLRNEILAGRLAPGAQVMQEEVARRLGVSPTPVREAFSILEAEGFLRSRPHRGVVVSHRDFAELIDIFEIRLVLESFAAERAAGRDNAESVGALERAVEAAGRVFKSGRVASLHGAAAEFHTILVGSAGSGVLMNMLRPLIARSQFYFPYSAERFVQSQKEHKQIIAALRAHDAARARAMLDQHMRVNIDLLRKASRDGERTAGRKNARAPKQDEVRLGSRQPRT